MNAALAESYEFCRHTARRAAKNFYYAFLLLPREQRQSMCALYAFLRHTDDLGDSQEPLDVRAAALADWRRQLADALAGQFAHPCLPAMADTLARNQIPPSLLEAVIEGVEMDLDIKRYENHEQLELYCYRVASVVGLLSIEIFGYRDPGCRDYADALGKALQFTNILRDVGNDAQRGRVYLPEEELRRHGVTASDILAGRRTEGFESLAAAFAGRTREYYVLARSRLPAVDRESMVAAELMGSVYWKLFRRLERRRFPVLDPEPVRLSKPRKLAVLLLAWMRVKTGIPLANYGS